MEDYSNNIPVNDRYSNAVALVIGEEMRGDSTASRPHGIVNSDCSLLPTSRGLFYSFQGTGTTMNITLTTIIINDDDDEDIRLEMAILLLKDGENDCQTSSSTTCLEFSDFLTYEDTPHSILLEETEIDQTYIVAVTGEKFDDVGVGEFGISVNVRHFEVFHQKAQSLL